MMGCFFPCCSSHKSHRRTLSRRKLTFGDRDCGEAALGLEEKNDGGVGTNGDAIAVDAVKEGKEMDSSREGELIPISPEVSSTEGATSVEQESSDSLFSISIESTDHSYGGVVAEMEVISPEIPSIRNVQSGCFVAIDRAEDKCSDAVFSPVDNLLPLRSPMGRSTSPLKNHHHPEEEENKENILMPGVNLPDSPQLCDISITASLSSWLVESDTTPESQRSVRSFRHRDDRRLLP